jgi:hypothetical protein
MLSEHWSKLLEELNKKIEIIGEVDILEIIADPYAVLSDLEKYVDITFEPNQRLVISQIDTLFFTKNSPYSINLYNLFVLISHLGLPTEHILILTNQKIVEEVDILANTFGVTPPKILMSYYNTIQTTDINLVEPKINERNIEYSYSCLNGLSRSARILLLSGLEEYSLLDKGMVTWNFAKKNAFTNTSNNASIGSNSPLPLLISGNRSLVNDMIILDDKGKDLFNKHYDKFLGTSRLHPLVKEFEKADSTKTFQPKFLQHALIYLVTETVAEYPYPYLSEKTFKGFLVKRPMIIWGAPNSIKRVKELGFKTWDSYWDESYDSITSISDRLKAICNIIEYMSKLNVNQLQDICINMQDVLEYNYHWYVNEFANNQLKKLVKNTDV